jgi:DNA-binding MarR family transcriptional regulator
MLKIANFLREELDTALEPLGMKVNHYNVLSVLTYKGAMSQQGVGTKLRIDRATMVAVVDDLERLGLVERRRNATDRRVYDLTVTDAGRKAVKGAERVLKSLEARVFEPLGSDGRAQLHALLEQLTSQP